MIEQPTDTVSGIDARTPNALAVTLPAGTSINGRYTIESVLGVGGSSVVYRAHDAVLATEVALKLIRSDRITPAAVVRFRREVAVARSVESEHVIRIHDVAESEHGLFITMELVDGESLRARLERGPLSVEQTLDVASQVLRGLAELHRVNVVHRDVKPSNILIRSDGRVKLADLGLARNFDDDEFRVTKTDAVVGTWEYLAPEQALGQPVDARTDLYAFGVVLYECLTGAMPFPGGSSIEGVLARLRQRPRDLRDACPDAPRWLVSIVERLLERQPSNRFASADELRSWIERGRAPRRWKRIAGSAAVAIAAIATLYFAIAAMTAPRFARIVASSDGRGIDALDARGAVLWHKDDVLARNAAPIRSGGRVTSIAVIAARAVWQDAKARSKLQFLASDTGAVERTATLPAPAFPSFDGRFGLAGITALNIDNDGNDLVLVTYVHNYWPSYSVVYDPVRRSVRTLFMASGHHTFLGVADVNGDGRNDLLLGGINNRMGWYSAVAALDLPPGAGSAPLLVYSVDSDEAGNEQPLLWYALLPSHYHGTERARISHAKREIVIPYSSARAMSLSFDGFATPLPRGMTAAARQQKRRAIYGGLRRVDRLLGGGAFSEALALVRSISRDASAIDDPCLAEWAQRVEIRALIRAGRVAEAEALTSQLVARSEARADIAFDAAHELHLQGRLDDAVRLYRAGLAEGSDTNAGRMRYEFVEGAVLALCEDAKWREAEEIVDIFSRTYPSYSENAEAYTNYIRWRRGQKDLAALHIGPSSTDLFRYWNLEFMRAAQPQKDLLPLITAEEQRGSSSIGLVWSLEADVLAARGDRGDALKLAHAAFQWCDARKTTDVPARAHLALVRERLAGIEAGQHAR